MPIKGENIYKRKDGRWEARYIREYRTDGSVRYGYCYGKTYREAKQKQTAARIEIIPPATNLPVEKPEMRWIMEDWLEMCQMRVKESTYIRYQGMLRRHILPYWENCRPWDLSARKVEDYSRYLLTQKGLAPKTVRDILSIFQSVIQCAGTKFPGAVPMIRVPYPRNDRKEPRVLSREEQRRLVSYLSAEGNPCKFGILLTLMTGMRIGELCALRWADISKEERVIQITATMQRITASNPGSGAKTRLIITAPKSDCSRRRIPLTGRAAELCEKNRCQDPQAYVLTGTRDAFLEPRAVQYRFQKYAKNCGLEGVHIHTLRHTFATRCVEVDFEIKALSEILGHASSRITLDRYVHASIQHKRENMRKLDSVGF